MLHTIHITLDYIKKTKKRKLYANTKVSKIYIQVEKGKLNIFFSSITSASIKLIIGRRSLGSPHCSFRNIIHAFRQTEVNGKELKRGISFAVNKVQ